VLYNELNVNTLREINNFLGAKDPVLGSILYDNVDCPLLHNPIITEDFLLYRICKTIVSQQLSTRAANTIWSRFENGLTTTNDLKKRVLELDETALNEFGISRQKVSYLKNLVRRSANGKFSLVALFKLSDKQIIDQLTSLKGIGVWSSEMFLIFCFKRLDVFSFGDSGLNKALKLLYENQELGHREIAQITSNWSPYRSVASWFLWRSLDSEKL